MIISWEGWTLDEANLRLVAPRDVDITANTAAMLSLLIRAKGSVVSIDEMGEAVRLAGSKSISPSKMTRVMVYKINKLVRIRGGIANEYTRGYHLTPLAGVLLTPEEFAARVRLDKIVQVLKHELEATGPHARVVARKIELIFARTP